ncbi:hypothetical protein DITRI_Ditri15bG0106300 [Diplodiscus trichospermus]
MNIILVLAFLISPATVYINLCAGSFINEGCIESERQALFMFKQDLIDHANRLGSWSHDEDCCRWDGVACDNVTGHVLELHLGNPQLMDDFGRAAEAESIERSMLRGKINPSLLKLKHLSYLDLSNNAFGSVTIPKFLGSIESLRHLDLSNAGFGGLVPHQLGNLSSLRFLNLQTDFADNLYVANLQWLSGLSFLEHLDLANVNLAKASNWLQVLNTLPSLENLSLSNCQLPQVPPPINFNLSSLAILDLSANYFNPLAFSWIFRLTNLVLLDLSLNGFEGSTPDGLENMTSLRYLDLSFNSFNSSVPDWLYNLNSLQILNLGSNNLQGKISSAIGNMTSAVSLDFSGNKLEGGIPRSMGNLCNLKSILFSGVNLSQDVSAILEILSGCVCERLEFLDLSMCQLFGQLTDQLGNFKVLKELYFSGNSISGQFPLSIAELSSLRALEIDQNKLRGHLPEPLGQLANFEILDISNNLLGGVVSEIHFGNLTKLKIFLASNNSLSLKSNPFWIPPFDLEILGLRSLDLGPNFPLWLHSQQSLTYLDISNSVITGSIPGWLWNLPFQFQYFNLSHNQIQGQIPNIPRTASVGSVIDLSFNQFSGQLPQVSSNMSFLDLSNNLFSGSLVPLLCYKSKETMGTVFINLGGNFLSGEIPDCWMNWENLVILKLDNNRLNGSIPRSMGTLHSLLSLHLQKNHLSGEIPLSLKNRSDLVLLDLGENELYGHIPKWIGGSLRNLTVLRFRSNKFSGYIPDELCAISSLQILDLANNDLFGSLPRCLSNFSAMIISDGSVKTDENFVIISGAFLLSLMMKGQMLEFSTNLKLVRSIDFSSNNLSGEIPMEMTSLFGLQSLNLSHNLLTGKIPKRIGEMISLESVDFSMNKLSGSIPESMSSLTFLSHLNLSYNNLTGEVPLGTQLQSFYRSSYVGNQLCGLPLPEKCPENGTVFRKVGNGGGENGNGFETDWFWLGMLCGFFISFWAVFGQLMIDKQKWRSIYTLSSHQTNVENQ